MNKLHAIAATALLLAGNAAAQGITVIAHPSVALPPEDVRDLFVGERQFAGNVRLLPVDNRAAQSGFLVAVLRMESVKYATLWAKKAFRDGLTAPPLKASDVEVIDFVRSTPGAIGYIVSAPASLRDVRVIADRL